MELTEISSVDNYKISPEVKLDFNAFYIAINKNSWKTQKENELIDIQLGCCSFK